jgi:hypothetical protein
LPRPAGRSGWLTTATTSVAPATASRKGTANAGDPKKTARGRSGISSPRAPPRGQIPLVALAHAGLAEDAQRLVEDDADGAQLGAELGHDRWIEARRRELAHERVVGAADVVAARRATQPEHLEVVALFDERVTLEARARARPRSRAGARRRPRARPCRSCPRAPPAARRPRRLDAVELAEHGERPGDPRDDFFARAGLRAHVVERP